MEEQAKFEGYAIVELMGRSVIAGYVSEQVIAGAAMASRLNVRAVEPWIVPTPAARPVLVDSMSGEDDQDEYDEDDEDDDEPLEVSGGW